MVEVRLYVEGGGDSESLRSQCREGFRKFLENAGLAGKMPRIVACGARQAAYDRFKTAIESNTVALLLIDSEDFFSSASPWEHLWNRPDDRFSRPSSATTTIAISWLSAWNRGFLRTRRQFKRFFGQGFNAPSLPQGKNIENISKSDIYTGLQRATSNCKTKAPYGKGAHSFRLLALVKPSMVFDASPSANRFREALKKFLE
ncbi:MAG: DUF4276 family protein [Candidatus Competibacteraceae bacterium]|nr:DUF4276 family protein [Candidatus Competibacteraceae bacterium]